MVSWNNRALIFSVSFIIAITAYEIATGNYWITQDETILKVVGIVF